MPEKGMAGLGPDDVWMNVCGKDKFPVPGPVEQKMKLIFRMSPGDAHQCFVSKPADPVKFAGKEQAGVHNDLHGKYPLFGRLYYFCV